MPGHWFFTNTNPAPFIRCCFCGQRITLVPNRKTNKWGMLYSQRFKAPNGYWMGGNFEGYVHIECPEPPEPKELI